MDSIRVWLEPNYDHGRAGAWLLDWPGAFTSGDSREMALARVTPAAHRFVDWLAEHGEAVPAVPLVPAEIVDEVAAHTLEDGYEVNATFAADDRQVTSKDVESTLRRLAFARSDLLSVVDRLQGFESVAEADERSVDEVLRHLAGAETWFVSRLIPSARYDGPRDSTVEYLRASRDFLADGLRRMVAERVESRSDGKGERWTLAKVVRRAIYHSLDHLDELDRRLAFAERRIERIRFSTDADLEPAALRRLFATAGLTRRSRDDDDMIRRWLAGTPAMISAWDGDALVGYARMLTDGATNGYVSTVAVAPRWQDRGLGSLLMQRLMHGRESMKLVLEAAVGAERFYERLGFVRAPNAFVRPRKST
jgi:ribosomal protein S18 acetylase RimI-like enzyme/predicted RNase H-like HicB family nuclease